ncbi:MAG: response regulator transcription factor [Sphingorhabdus sp.]
MENPVPIALLSRNTLVREGLRRILSDENFSVNQSLEESSHLLEISAQEEKPKLIIIDSGQSNDLDCNVLRLQDRFPSARIVILSDNFDFEHMVNAFRAGVHGYIVKQIACAPLIGSLQLVAMGEKVMPTELVSQLPERLVAPSEGLTGKIGLTEMLSDREVETLRCLVMGYSNKHIARRLEISEATVKVHVKAILRKLQVQNRTQAAIWAVNQGVVLSGMTNLETLVTDTDDLEEDDFVEEAQFQVA